MSDRVTAPMQEYIGIKRITAWPQEKNGQSGYAVRYPDGYVSWSPKDEFEKSYMPLTFEPEIGAASSRGEIVNYPTKDAYEKFARAVSAGDDGTCHHLLDFLVHWASIGAPKIDNPEYVYTKPPRGALRIQELLPDNYSESKDWRDGDIAERIEWLKGTVEAKSNECDMLWDWMGDKELLDADDNILTTVCDRLREASVVIHEFLEDGHCAEDQATLARDAGIVENNLNVMRGILKSTQLAFVLLYSAAEMGKQRDTMTRGTGEYQEATAYIITQMRTFHDLCTARKTEEELARIVDIAGIRYDI